MAPRNQTVALAWAALLLALVLLLLWIPFDTQSGIVETSRRRVLVGDALAPVVSGVFILLGAVLLAVQHKVEQTDGLSSKNLRFVFSLIALGALSFALMRWAGPLVAMLFGHEYRLLRANVPWKYIGFALGGWVMVFGLVTLMERKPSRRGALFAIGVVAFLIAAYDLPFEDLLLPPNGDV